MEEVKERDEIAEKELMKKAGYVDEEIPEMTNEEIIIDLKKKNKNMILLARQQKDTIHRASMKINKMERDLFVAQNQVDSMGGLFIAMVQKFGINNQLSLSREEVELIAPGTMIDDEETEKEIILKIIDADQIPPRMSPQMMIMGPNGPVPMIMGPDGKPIMMGPNGPVSGPPPGRPHRPIPVANQEPVGKHKSLGVEARIEPSKEEPKPSEEK